MPILDTDVLTIIQRRAQPQYSNLEIHLNALRNPVLRTSIISFEEQLRGWLAYIKSAKLSQLAAAYRKLAELNEDFSTRPVLPFDERAVLVYERLMHARTGLGAMDLKIASVAIANRDVLISKNLRHFRKVPDLKVEDWTVAPSNG